MKFSEISEETWAELQPYLDTCLLPVSGLSGLESPWEATNRVMQTGDWLAHLERAFHGRTVTMPAYHYDLAGSQSSERLNELCERMKKSGFRYVIVVSGQVGGVPERITAADLRIQPSQADEAPDSNLLRQAVSALWREGKGQN